jgi:hypothetical protein
LAAKTIGVMDMDKNFLSRGKSYERALVDFETDELVYPKRIIILEDLGNEMEGN